MGEGKSSSFREKKGKKVGGKGKIVRRGGVVRDRSIGLDNWSKGKDTEKLFYF